MKRLLAIPLMLLLAACGEPVEVPPAYVGKILTADGFKEGIIPPSKFRLDICFTLCDNLVIAEASDHPVREQLKLWMPKDKLNLVIDLRGVYSVVPSDRNMAKVFSRLTAEKEKGQERISKISMTRIYDTYAQQTIREVIRTRLIKYNIEEVMKNREAINGELLEVVRQRLESSPMKVITFGMADVQPPGLIIKANEVAKEREVEIATAEAQKQIELKKAEVALELAERDKAIRLTKAEAILLENKKVAESVTPQYLQYRYLEVMEKMAESGRTVFFPVEMTKSIGLQNRLFMEKSQPTVQAGAN